MPTPLQPLEIVAEGYATGLVGTIGVTIYAFDGSVEAARSTSGITELGTTGIYRKTITTPGTPGTYFIVWDAGGVQAEETLVIDAAPVVPAPPPVGSGVATGPCTPWIVGSDVVPCSTADAAALEPFALEASQLLYTLSGRQFPGGCSATARPCVDECGCFSALYPGGEWRWGGAVWEWAGSIPLGLVFPSARACGCGRTSRVKLAGYPVRAVSVVKIDGALVDASLYRLDDHRHLTRLADPDGSEAAWPACQRLDLADTEPGTFSVAYTWGADPPEAGRQAAMTLACELWKARHEPGKCRLSDNIVRVVRQGVAMERGALPGFANGRTGLRDVDAFLGTYNPQNRQRRSAVWSPDTQPFARRLG